MACSISGTPTVLDQVSNRLRAIYVEVGQIDQDLHDALMGPSRRLTVVLQAGEKKQSGRTI